MLLIVNADDFGLTEGVNLGILESIKKGVVRSTTMMPNKPAFSHAVSLYKKENLSAGIHLTLSTGRPVTGQTNSLTDDNGNFHNLSYLIENYEELLPCEIELEFISQITKLEAAGVEISHLDSHHHVHTIPIIREVFLNIAEKMDLPIRNGIENLPKKFKSPDLITDFYKDGVSVENFIELIENYKGDCPEIMVHPAFIDEELKNESSYSDFRLRELEVLTSDRIKEYICGKKIELINYREFNSRIK